MLLCCVACVGMTLCGVGFLPWCSGKVHVIRQPALLGDLPRSKFVHRSRLPIFLDGRLKGLSETFIGNQVHASIRVTVSLFRSNCSLFSEALAVFHLVKFDVREKMSPRDFIVILSCRGYFVVSWILNSKHYTCNGCRV